MRLHAEIHVMNFMEPKSHKAAVVLNTIILTHLPLLIAKKQLRIYVVFLSILNHNMIRNKTSDILGIK